MASSSKAIAIRKSFQRNRMLQNILTFFHVCVAFVLFSRSSFFPILLEAFSYSYGVFSTLLNHPFYMFLLLNAMILCIFALSSFTNNDSGSGEIYDEFLNNRDSRFKTPNDPQEFTPEKPNPKENSLEKLRICSEVVTESSVFHKTVTAVTETTSTTTTTCCTTVSSGEEKDSGKKCYRRVQSERRRVVVAAPRRELRRFNTGLSKQVQGRSYYVEELSKEEFNRTVDDFIARQKKMLLEEARQLQKTEYLALTS